MGNEYGQASVLRQFGEPLVVESVPLPDPEPGALLVRVDVATVCGSDVHIWRGDLVGVLPIELPMILGHEIVGEVVMIGADADVDSVGTPLAVGDRVVWTHEPCRRCHTCTVLRQPQLCPARRVGMLESCARFPYVTGAFAEYSYVWPKAGRLRVPDALKSEHASASSCALRTVVRAFENVGSMEFEDRVVIQGAGPLGLFATAIASTYSPKQLIVIGAPDDRLALAREWGADVTVSIDEYPEAADRQALIDDLTGGMRANILFEMSGGPEAFAEGLGLAAPRARYGIVGTVSGRPQAVLAHQITNREVTIVGTFGSDIDGYQKAMEFMVRYQGRFDWDRMLGQRFGLDGVTAALESMRDGLDLKPIISPQAVS